MASRQKVRLHRPKAAFLAGLAVGVTLFMTNEPESVLLGEGFHLRHNHRILARSSQTRQVRVVDNADGSGVFPKLQSLIEEALHPEAVEHPIKSQVPSLRVAQVQQAGDHVRSGIAQQNRIWRRVVLHLGARRIRNTLTSRLVVSTDAQLPQQTRQCGVLDRDMLLLDQFLVHALSESVAFLIKPLQQVRINLDLVGARVQRHLALSGDDRSNRVRAHPELAGDLVAADPLLVQQEYRLALVRIDHAVSSSLPKTLATDSRFRPSGSSGTCPIRSNTSAVCPSRIASRNDAGPRKYPWASCSISRTLSFFPLRATTKSSMSCFFTPFMRMNCLRVYM